MQPTSEPILDATWTSIVDLRDEAFRLPYELEHRAISLCHDVWGDGFVMCLYHPPMRQPVPAVKKHITIYIGGLNV